MLAILAQPDEIALSKNPIIFRFYSTDGGGDPYMVVGVRSEMETTGYTNIPEDDTLVVNWTDPEGGTGSVTFTAKNAPVTENEIPADETAHPDWISYYNAIAEKIMAHHLLSPFFKSYAVDNGGSISLWIEALDPDASWQLAFNAAGITPPVTVTNHTDVTSNPYPDNYKVLLEVFFEDIYQEGTFRKVASLDVPPNAAGQTTFNLQEILDAEMQASLPSLMIPEFSNSDPIKADVVRQYYITYREDYDGISNTDWTPLTIAKILCGGIAQNLFSDYDIFSNLDANNSLLSFYPSGKTVSTDQPEYIAWYNYTGSSKEIVLELQETTKTGLQPAATYEHGGNGITVGPDEVLLIPVGYDQLGISNAATRKYEVRVVDEASDYGGGSPEYFSQSRSYYIDLCHYNSLRYIMYLNSFCCPETLRCIGDFKTQLQVPRSESERILTPDNSSTTAERFQYDQAFDNYFTYNSGFLSAFEVDALQELLIYNQLYEVYTDGYIQLKLTENKFDITESRQFLHATSFQAIPATRQGQYSNIVIPMTDDQEGWATQYGDYWRTTFGKVWAIS